MNKWFLILILSSYALAAHSSDLACANNGKNWQPQNTQTGKFIGRSGYGWVKKKGCEDALAVTGDIGACNWNGTYYSAYNPDGTSLGQETNYADVKTCTTAITKRVNGLLCLWNNSNWQPWSIEGKVYLGRTGNGFVKLKDCQQIIEGGQNGNACNWNGKDYSIYGPARPDTALVPMTFAKSEDCTTFMEDVASQKQEFKSVDYSTEDLLTPYHGSNSDVGYTLSHCHDPNHSYHNIKTDDQGQLLPGCMPDTLYSWGDWGKIAWYKQNYGAKGQWTTRALDRRLYTTPSPLGTFAYGPILMRLKLRPDARNKLSFGSTSCNTLSDAEKADTVLVVYWNNKQGTGVDYILCSMGPVESWSYGTQENYDEVLREKAWVESHDYKEYELYYKRQGVDQLIGLTLDSHEFTADGLNNNLRVARQLVDLKVGGIFADDPAQKKEHFKTAHPIYFNPD